ncbi:MAG: hypothetical protein B6I22_11995 [Desulfobacteraceae bacterium 4572_123]|nr:MAG: hypothetical protein B6I22_11995 [Desulfobacteraceae bacterium 4572_123]
MTENARINGSKIRVLTRLIACVVILVIGGFGMLALARMKEKPPEVPTKEHTVKVELMQAAFEDHLVVITGFGEARARDIVRIAPQVGGAVIQTHAALEVGGIIAAGQVLFEIDKVDYEAAYEAARATAGQLEQTVVRLEKQFEVDRIRQKTLERSRELARTEYERVRKLFEKHKVGAQSRVDQAEQAFNSAKDMADQMALAVELYPIRIREAKSGLAAARAGLKKNRADLDRTVVRAPFDARVVSVNLKKGQLAQPGMTAVTLADDSELEIVIPIDSRDARNWLQFENSAPGRKTAWFSRPVPVPCTILWTEDKNSHAWEGVLDRVVAFNEKTRTVNLAVRISGEKAFSSDAESLPLVQGMFCSVSIPGKTMKNAIRLPRRAVTFENTVYVERDGRLKTLQVEVARLQGDYAFISKGIEPGTRVIEEGKEEDKA